MTDNRGVLYNLRILRLGALLTAVVLCLHGALAQGSAPSVPEPAPTDAVKVSGRKLTVEGKAPKKQGMVNARYAALLDGYAHLLKHGLENGLFPGSWSEQSDEFRFYRADSDHPAPDVVSWITRSKVLGEKDGDADKTITLESPEMGTIATAQPEMRAVVTQDVDQDGLSDVVGVGYDGSIYIMKSPGQGESKVAARSPSYALLELVSGPGYERVRAAIPQDVGAVEVVAPGEARVLLQMELLEMVNGRLMGRTIERREVLIALEGSVERIRFSINEPPDFAKLFDKSVEIRGNTISDKTLENVEIRHNGGVAWESPEGIGIRALQFNLASDLVSGWNSFQITARDSEGYSQVRELWVESPKGSAPEQGPKRAVILTLDDKMKEDRLIEALGKAGFARNMITIFENGEATSQGFLNAVRENRGASELLLYCETFSVPGSLVGGKTLRVSDGQIDPSALAGAIDAGGYKKCLGLVYSELPRGDRGTVDLDELWFDTQTFLERLGYSGRLFLANVENIDENPRRQRSRSRDRLMEALKTPGESDLARLLDKEEPANTLFRGWMYGSPVLGSPVRG